MCVEFHVESGEPPYIEGVINSCEVSNDLKFFVKINDFKNCKFPAHIEYIKLFCCGCKHSAMPSEVSSPPEF